MKIGQTVFEIFSKNPQRKFCPSNYPVQIGLRNSSLIFTTNNSPFLRLQNLLQLLLISTYFLLEMRRATTLPPNYMTSVMRLVSTLWTFPLCQAIFHQHYGVYASQLSHYALCCSTYSDFLSRHRALVTRFLSQGYKVNRLSNTLKIFYGRHTDLVGQYKKNVCQMFADCSS